MRPGERDLLARQPARVAGAVVALVVGERDLGGGLEQLDAGTGQHRVTERGVRLELAALARRERAGLAGDGVRDGGHAHVVQAAGDPDQVRVEAEPLSHERAVATHPLQVRADLHAPRSLSHEPTPRDRVSCHQLDHGRERSCARAARPVTWSFAWMRARCHSTVRTLRCTRSAISRLVWPSASSARTSRSRRLSLSGAGRRRRRASARGGSRRGRARARRRRPGPGAALPAGTAAGWPRRSTTTCPRRARGLASAP